MPPLSARTSIAPGREKNGPQAIGRIEPSKKTVATRVDVVHPGLYVPERQNYYLRRHAVRREFFKVLYLSKSDNIRRESGMGGVLGTWRLFALPFLIWLTCLVPTELHAQTCTLKAPLPTTMVDAAPATRFLPSGREGQILVKRKYSSSSVAAVFVTSGTEAAKWKVLSEAPVISIKAAPEKAADGKVYEGFSSADSSVVRFLVPETESFWENLTFAVRACDHDGDALAIVIARVSTPAWAKLISAGVIVLFYLGFALAVSTARGQPHPLVTKYPAFANRQIDGWLKTLDPIILTADAFNRGSVQNLQVLLFSFLVSGMVLSLVLTEGVLSDLSETVALLLGISAVGAAVAKKATESRERLGFENWAWLVKKSVLPINEARSLRYRPGRGACVL
jgi:hypothetical protein